MTTFKRGRAHGLKYLVAPQKYVSGQVLVLCGKNWNSNFLKIYKKEKCSHIRIPDITMWESGLDFLDEFKSAGFKIHGMDIDIYKQKDLSKVALFPELKLFNTYAQCNVAPDFSEFEHLEVLMFDHRRAFEPSYKATKPHHLNISKYPAKDLSKIESFKNLETLHIHGGKLETLDGIEQFSKLKDVIFYGLRNLKSIKALEKCPHLTHTIVENCKNVEDYDEYEHLLTFYGRQ